MKSRFNYNSKMTFKTKNLDGQATFILNGHRKKFTTIEITNEGKVIIDGVERTDSPSSNPMILIQGSCGDITADTEDLIIAGDVMGAIIATGSVYLDKSDSHIRGGVTSIYGDVSVHTVIGDVNSTYGLIEAMVVHGDIDANEYCEIDPVDHLCDECQTGPHLQS